jgi:N6-adenosine-specific RNA methylase IME4
MNIEQLITLGLKFGTLYVDPPWSYSNKATRNAADNHYSSMTIEQIKNLPVKQLVEDDAHLHLWTTNAFLFESKAIMEKWGFEYKSCYVWVKPQMGMGNYWRVSHEFMLFGIRGKAPVLRRNAMSWGNFPRSRHSAKPDEVRSIIETFSPSTKRIELFGRKLVPGWFVWGNEISDDAMFHQIENKHGLI